MQGVKSLRFWGRVLTRKSCGASGVRTSMSASYSVGLNNKKRSEN